MLRQKLNKFSFFLASFLLFVIPPSLCWASNNLKGVEDPYEQKIIVESLKKLQSGISSVVATIYQEKHLRVLKKDLQIRGSIILQKPNRLRMETAAPEQSITVVNGKTMTVYHPVEKEAEVYDFTEDIIAKNTMQFFNSIVWGSFKRLKERFKVKMLRDNNLIVFELSPLSSIIAKYLSSITIEYDAETGLPEEFTLITPGGDKIQTRLSDIKINTTIKPGTFDLILPADVWITNRIEDDENRKNNCCY